MTKEESYPTDLTDEQFEFIKQLVPESSNFGRPCLNLRQVLNALFYVVVGGIAWRMLPKDLPKWKSVYHYFWKWRKSGEWQRIYDALRQLERHRLGKQTEPVPAALIRNQSKMLAASKKPADMMRANVLRDGNDICWLTL